MMMMMMMMNKKQNFKNENEWKWNIYSFISMKPGDVVSAKPMIWI
jgi:hypothetical protein